MNSEMTVKMHLQPGENGMTDISLVVPIENRNELIEILCSILALIGIDVRMIDENGDEFIPSTELFPTVTPGMILRCLRIKENISLDELAVRLGSSSSLISDIEQGKINIPSEVAKCIAEEFKVPYKAFL